MRSPSFIGELLARHPDYSGIWPGENLLTEATAAVLRRAEPLAADLLARMVSDTSAGPAPRPPVEVFTQHHIHAVGRPDLVLRAPGRLVWIEVKDWARESGDQLTRYLNGLDKESVTSKALVYLTRTRAAPPSVAGVSVWHWSDVGQVIAESRARRADELNGGQLWLIEDYLLYLRERGLAVTEALAPDFTKVMHDFAETSEKLRMLRGMVDDRLRDAGWEKTAEGFGKTAADWDDLWVAYVPQPERAYASCAFDWGILDLSSGDEPVVIAGLWFGADWAPAGHETWLENMLVVRHTEDPVPFRPNSVSKGALRPLRGAVVTSRHDGRVSCVCECGEHRLV